MSEEIKRYKTKKVMIGNELTSFSCHYLGDITLGKHVHISDPCYDRDVWCRAELRQVKPGTYRVYTVHNDGEGRVQQLMLLQAEKYAHWQFFVRWSMGESVGVDSGQLGVFDDSIYPKEKEKGTSYDDPNTFYGKCCLATLSEDREGLIDGAGAVTRSGYGDGSYRFLTNDGVSINAFMIDFLSESVSDSLLLVLSMSDPKIRKTTEGSL